MRRVRKMVAVAKETRRATDLGQPSAVVKY